MEKLIFWCGLGGAVLLFQVFDLYSGTFFCISFLFWLCAFFMPLGHDVIAEAGCNWYLRDINICSLLKKRFTNIWVLILGMVLTLPPIHITLL
jgi:hypothetical protein